MDGPLINQSNREFPSCYTIRTNFLLGFWKQFRKALSKTVYNLFRIRSKIQARVRRCNEWKLTLFVSELSALPNLFWTTGVFKLFALERKLWA